MVNTTLFTTTEIHINRDQLDDICYFSFPFHMVRYWRAKALALAWYMSLVVPIMLCGCETRTVLTESDPGVRAQEPQETLYFLQRAEDE